MLKIAVFVSGRGSNLKAIANAIPIDLPKVEIKAVISNKTECTALNFAGDHNISTFVVGSKEIQGKISYNELNQELKNLEIDLIVLAGYLKKIPDDFVDSYPNKIINIHPALLPSFGGNGMYGMNVHKAVFNISAQVSGVSIHFVNKIYDNGQIIAQRCVDISDVESPEEIAERVLKIEHKLLPFVIKKFSEDKIKVKDNRVYIVV